MTETQEMLREVNSFIRAIGETEIAVSANPDEVSELDYLREVKNEYKKRLLKKVPKYERVPEKNIPDLFLAALRRREATLTGETAG